MKEKDVYGAVAQLELPTTRFQTTVYNGHLPSKRGFFLELEEDNIIFFYPRKNPRLLGESPL